MLPLAVVVVGALIGFVGSRTLRRPQSAAQAASVARTVGGTMGRRKGLTAPELQRAACFSEMVRHVRVDAQGRSVAPARYLLQVHPDDLAVVNDAHDWFVSGLSEALTVASRDNGWVLDGAIDLKFEADPSRRPGVPNALAVEPATTTQAKPAMPGKSSCAGRRRRPPRLPRGCGWCASTPTASTRLGRHPPPSVGPPTAPSPSTTPG